MALAAESPSSTRSRICYLGLGSNLGAKAHNLAAALSLLAREPGLTLRRVSSVYLTQPVGLTDQPDFLNLVACFETGLPPEALLEVTLSVEERLGRVRTTRWGPRTADLDILLIGTLQISEPALTVPHPRMRERQFVLVPLAEIAPDLELPDGTLIRDLAEGESESVRRIGRLTDVLSQEPESREVGG